MVCVNSADDFLPAHESSQFDLQRLEIDKGITLDHAVEIISTELGDGADCKQPKRFDLLKYVPTDA